MKPLKRIHGDYDLEKIEGLGHIFYLEKSFYPTKRISYEN